MSDPNPEAVRERGLDPNWVTSSVLVDGHRPSAATFAGFIGTGQMSRNVRFQLDWSADVVGPSSVVIKLPSNDAGTRAMSFEHGVYAKECRFYELMAPLVDVCVPALLGVDYDDVDQDFALALEDLDHSVQGDQFTEPTHRELELAIEQAAALQAPVWNRTDAAVFDVFRDDVDERAARAEQMMPAFRDLVIERLGSGLEPDIIDLLNAFTDIAARWTQVRAAGTTLVHGDFRPDNFLLGVDESAPPIAVVDWQTVALGRGVTDVAYLLAGALEPAQRREVETEMLALYQRELAGRGVAYDDDECRRDYALGSLHGVVIATTATAMAEHTDRGDALFTLMLNRHGRHALDVGALDLVDEMS